MDNGADFLHGVQMEHAHIKGWQLQLYLFTTHLAFGPSLLAFQMKQSGWRYWPRLATYMTKALKAGFDPYGAFTYFAFYGYDHLTDGLRLPERPKPGLAWRTFMALNKRWLGHSGLPQPNIVKSAKGRAKVTLNRPPAKLKIATEIDDGLLMESPEEPAHLVGLNH